jgi:hypothetical protein
VEASISPEVSTAEVSTVVVSTAVVSMAAATDNPNAFAE